MLTGEHQPYGTDDPYKSSPTERFPRDPAPAQAVQLGFRTERDAASAWVEVRHVADGVESRAIERVLGYAHGEQLGVPIWDFVHPDDLVSAAGAFNETNRKLGYHHPVEFRVRTRDGGWVRCEVSGTSLEGPGGQWLVLSLRPTRDRSEVMARRQRIESLIRTASVECSTVHWRAADRLVGEFLGELADVVGAVRAELAWEVGGNGLVLAARWPGWHPRLAEFLMRDPLAQARAGLHAALDALEGEPPQRELFPADGQADGGGGGP